MAFITAPTTTNGMIIMYMFIPGRAAMPGMNTVLR